MMHRYFFIEPSYSDPDTFCSITIGSGRARANIQMYIDESNLGEVAHALTAAELKSEHPLREPFEFDSFDFHMSVLPLNAGERVVRFQVNQGMREDGAPFAADIRFVISNKEAANLARDLRHWLTNKKYAFEWKP